MPRPVRTAGRTRSSACSARCRRRVSLPSVPAATGPHPRRAPRGRGHALLLTAAPSGVAMTGQPRPDAEARARFHNGDTLGNIPVVRLQVIVPWRDPPRGPWPRVRVRVGSTSARTKSAGTRILRIVLAGTCWGTGCSWRMGHWFRQGDIAEGCIAPVACPHTGGSRSRGV